MAQSLDLEEQEQLDQIKHFWNQYGNLITWVLIAVFGSVAAWNGWQYWQNKQALGASVLFDEIDRAVTSKDVSRMERAFTDIRDQYGNTAFAQQSALLVARGMFENGDAGKAKAALEWTAAQSKDESLQAIARLRLAGLALDSGATDEAKKWLMDPMPTEFSGLRADRQGDVHLRAGQKKEAKEAYLKAYQSLDDNMEYKRLVEVKLNALGIDPSVPSTQP